MFTTLPFDAMPKLNDHAKEFISLGSWSLYRKEGKLLLVAHGGCACCHGGRPTQYFILDEDGSYKEMSTEEFYRKQDSQIEIIKFELPERLTRHYIKFSL